jgi:ABC-type branched-subunit amino acid transport system substrate-binding protein
MILAPRTTGLALSLGLAVGALLGACSLAVNFDECRNDADCITDGGDQWSCTDGRCVAPPADETSTGPTTVAPTTDDSTTTGDTDDTTDATTEPVAPTTGDTDSSSSDTGAVTCAVNSECEAALGDGNLCVAGTCVSALTEECQRLVWPSGGASHDKVVLLGSIIPASPPFDAITVPLENAVQLAIEDYNRTTDLPGGNRVAWLACDDAGSVDRALAAAQHLTGTLKVPAIVGPVFSEQVIAVAEQVTIPAGTFLITPSATSKQITALVDDDLVWRPISSDVYQANALADRVLELEPAALKVNLLGKADAYGKGIISDVTKVLNPKLMDGFKSFEYPDPVSKPPDEIMNEYAAILGTAWGAKGDHPDTVLFAGTSEVVNLVLGTMIAWGSENPPPAVPRFIVTHGAVPSMEDIVNSAPAGIKPLLMSNVEGVAPDVLDPQNFASFNIRYKIRFNDADAITASSLGYDAALVTIFSMAAISKDDPITGAAIAANVSRLVDGMATKVSFNDVDGTELVFIKKAHNALVSGQNVDLKGVSGELDFDLATGEVRTNVVGWGLVPKQDMPDVPVLTPLRLYVLDDAPAFTGTWMDL